MGWRTIECDDPVPVKRSIKDTFLAFAIVVAGRTLLSTAAGRRLFDRIYLVYKNLFEGRTVRHLKTLVAGDAWIVDAGANAGFFTSLFSDWISGSGRVLAIEPAPANVKRLNDTLASQPQRDRVEIIEAAISDTDGQAHLRLDELNPADHQLAKTGLPVTTVTLDRLMSERGWPTVGLIKIDVQGAEPLVITGATETLRRQRPALFLEIADSYLRPFGCTGVELRKRVADFGYTCHTIGPAGVSRALSDAEADRLIETNSYIDLLFLPRR